MFRICKYVPINQPKSEHKRNIMPLHHNVTKHTQVEDSSHTGNLDWDIQLCKKKILLEEKPPFAQDMILEFQFAFLFLPPETKNSTAAM